MLSGKHCGCLTNILLLAVGRKMIGIKYQKSRTVQMAQKRLRVLYPTMV